MLIWPALFGLAWGSFLGVVWSRLPSGGSLLHPPSHCPRCRRRLTPWELIPILSFLALRGRCRGCGVRIGWREPLLEAASALSLAAGWQAAGTAGSGAVAAALLALVWLAAHRERTARSRAHAPQPTPQPDLTYPDPGPTCSSPAPNHPKFAPTHTEPTPTGANPGPPYPNPGEAGFTLAEVAVSAALTALVAAGVFSSTAALAGFLAAEEQRQAAVALARARLEQFRGQPTLGLACNTSAPLDQRLTPEGFRVATVLRLDCAPGELEAPQAHITVTVSYQRTWSGKTEEVVLAMVRRDPL